jgi:hypothetical protein
VFHSSFGALIARYNINILTGNRRICKREDKAFYSEHVKDRLCKNPIARQTMKRRQGKSLLPKYGV